MPFSSLQNQIPHSIIFPNILLSLSSGVFLYFFVHNVSLGLDNFFKDYEMYFLGSFVLKKDTNVIF